MTEPFETQLQALRANALYRKLREVGSAQGAEIDLVGEHLVNFSSNDYLGLANDPRLRDAAAKAIAEFGVGAGASRLISGTQSPHVQLEAALAQWKGTQAAVTFSSGYAAAVGTLQAVATKSDVIILDKLCHASLIDGAKLSGATLRVFPHNHLGKLESHLQWARGERPDARVIVATESVFSMDGDRAPLRAIVELKKRFNALLLLDEAHAVGVIGANGRGLADEEGVAREIDVQLGTLSKALGASGGYICGSRSLIDWLVNRARSFIYSTAPPPAVAAAATAAVQFVASAEGEERRRRLCANMKLLRELLWLPGASASGESAIFPWHIGDEQAALDLARALRGDGFLVPAIRYPTVARGAARLRITITAAHSEAQVRALCAALARHQQSTPAAASAAR